jgi:hypothetical protein
MYRDSLNVLSNGRIWVQVGIESCFFFFHLDRPHLESFLQVRRRRRAVQSTYSKTVMPPVNIRTRAGAACAVRNPYQTWWVTEMWERILVPLYQNIKQWIYPVFSRGANHLSIILGVNSRPAALFTIHAIALRTFGNLLIYFKPNDQFGPLLANGSNAEYGFV